MKKNDSAATKAKSGRAARPVWKTVLMWIFFPVGLFDLWMHSAIKRYRMDISTKTALINTAVFALLFVFYTVIIFAIVCSDDPDGELVLRLVVISVLFFLGFTAVFVAASALSVKSMLAPVRKMISKMDEITGDDMSARLDPLGTRDELDELSERINSMLDGIEETFKRQSNFISDASHELRTPIAVIRGYSDLLSRWGKTDVSVLDESIDAIRAEAENMKTIVDQLLYLAKLGEFKLHVTDFDLAEAVSDVVSAYQLTDTEKEITADIKESIPVRTDRSLAVEMIRIITDNAIKYTPAGGKIHITATAGEDGGGTVSVKDNGIGIGEEDLPHIFDRFYRCDKARGRKEGSTGLGLAIAKSIAEMTGGSITAKSILGEGSEFTVFFPPEDDDAVREKSKSYADRKHLLPDRRASDKTQPSQDKKNQ